MDLFKLIRKGDVPRLRAALAEEVTPDARDDEGNTPLMVAATLGNTAMVDALLDAGAQIGLINQDGLDALSCALWESHLDLAWHLVSHGAPVHIEQGAALGDLERLKREWAILPPVEETIGAFLGACRTGRVDVIGWFLDLGMPVDLHPPGYEWGGIGCSGLHHASVHDHAEAVRLLLAHGSDVTLVDDVFGSQALAWAASAGAEEVVSILLDAGAERAHKNIEGRTAADLARSNEFEDLARRLS